jgi:mRNA-degrading endonuclease RelE of RelBE toxin-antitoxin system
LTYGVYWARAAQQGLVRVPERCAADRINRIERLLAEQPYRLSKPLAGPFAGWRSARYGAYRIVFEVSEEKAVVVIRRIGHRSDIYRP